MKNGDTYPKVTCKELPKNPDKNTVYRLVPQNADIDYFAERTNRNIGWITNEEQQALRSVSISIAGCGGMGGQIAEKMVRLGIGEIRIADPEEFDISNINRQFAARRNTVGISKAFETARMLRDITDDSTIEVYAQGIDKVMLPEFLRDTAIILDEIEFWNIGSCILMHQYARSHGVPILNALTVGFAAYVHFFTPTSTPVEEMLGMTLEEGLALEKAVAEKTVTQHERNRIMDAALKCFIPVIPKYYANEPEDLHKKLILDRLQYEGRAPIIATNPPFAGGIVADQALIIILESLGLARRSLPKIPSSPGYVMMDAATFEVSVMHSRVI